MARRSKQTRSKQTMKQRVHKKMKKQESFLLNTLLSLSIQLVLLTFVTIMWSAVFLLRCIRYYIPDFIKEQRTLYAYRVQKSKYSKQYQYDKQKQQ